MGNKILIYDNGQVYEIDSDQIYTPYFIVGRRTSTNHNLDIALKDAMRQLKDKNDTVSEENQEEN